MFPLQCLVLLFISPREQPVGTRGEEEEEEEGRQGVRETDRKWDLRRGDLLEVPRTLFTHFGIYLGEGRVSHFIPDGLPLVCRDQRRIRRMVTNSRLLLGVLTKRGSVRTDSVEDFAYGAQIRVNTLDTVVGRGPLQAEQVALRAERLHGNGSYSLLWFNCEHYVMFCRYGASSSLQTFQFCKTVRKLVLSRRVAMVMPVVCVCVMSLLGCVTPASVLMSVLLPFIIWMAA
ncbi:lecithin retinol acyltransferase-like [Eleginops maclovinus]|uniref:lecithin retinol acyltransferase-like n=1 Tax=Eleginops maclovinus TaxID=56733 RepID=UPI003080DC73